MVAAMDESGRLIEMLQIISISVFEKISMKELFDKSIQSNFK
jgi:hypothetical protein